jgi:HEAT repeat protein
MRRAALALVLALTAAPARADDAPPALCEADWLIDAARAGLAQGSPAYQSYLRALLKESALSMPIDALLEAVTAETDPATLEALGAALATRASYEEDPGLIQPLLDRAMYDADPALRAAAVRGLRATGSVEAMATLGDAISYESLVRDPAPEVRAAVADNLVAENRDVYGGRDERIANTAVRVAAASADPAVAGRILAEISMERASPESVAELARALDAGDPRLRAGAARALGSSPPAEATAEELVARYRREDDAEVRKAILYALARLGQARAIPTLKALRGLAPELDSEIDAWIAALGLGLQEWHLILREKERRLT